MAVRRRRPAPTKGPSGPTSRVRAVEDLEQWDTMLEKAASGRRLVVCQFFQAQNYACAQMRSYFRRMSVDPSLKRAVFAEIEVDAVEADLLAECGVVQGVTRIPHYACYLDGEEVETYTGGQPSEVQAMIQRQLALLHSGSSLLTKLLLAASGAAAIGAALWWRLRGGGGGGGDGAPANLAEELRSLGERIRLAQQRKRNCERAGKLKGAKHQARILRQLQAQRQAVEQQMLQREQPGGGAAPGGPGGSRGRKGRGRRQQGGASPIPEGIVTAQDSSDDEGAGSGGGRRRRPPPPGVVLYSDEE